MTLAAGSKLGPYEILGQIGAGGMGEVYRARDPRLGREVAIKVLPASFSADRDRLRRFEQEARAAGLLNHPNITAVYDIGSYEAAPFVVQELLEGVTLRSLLSCGKLSPRKTIGYAKPIADGLAAAHDKGIIHRDLKPENLFVTKDERVKILDFGLAKLTHQEDGGPLSRLPTATTPTTDSGIVMGTVGYMSPEQVRGKPTDARSDIFSFGLILYEMLSGRRAFQGESTADTMSAILKEDPPDLLATNQNVSPGLERIVRHCLEKTPERRFQSARDLAFDLEALSVDSGGVAAGTLAPQARRIPHAFWLGIAGLLAGAIAATLLPIRHGSPRAAPGRPIRFEIAAPQDRRLVGTIAVARDGSRLVFGAREPGGPVMLWMRALGDAKAETLPGTEEAQLPFWSPDGRSVGFFANGELKRIAISGGPPEALAATPDPRGASWGADDRIVFAPDHHGPLMQVSASGGKATSATTLNEQRREGTHRWPWFLPDGRHFLYYSSGSSGREPGDLFVGELGSSNVKRITESSSLAVYASPGYLVFVRGSTLVAQAFDPDRLELRGEAAPLGVDLPSTSWTTGQRALSASFDGTLSWYTPPRAWGQPVLVDRRGQDLGRLVESGSWTGPRLSPDGRRLVMSRATTSTPTGDLWVIDVSRSVATRTTTDPGDDTNAIWSPDGTRLVFTSDRGGPGDLYIIRADEPESEKLLLASEVSKFPLSWSPDGRFLIFGTTTPQTWWDLWLLPLEGDRKPVPFLATPFAEGGARFSPDGRWVAYDSDVSGTSEIYVRPFRESGGTWRVSSRGGRTPSWRGDGREIYYLAPDSTLMAAPVTGVAPFRTASPVPLFNIASPESTDTYYDVFPDGKRFIVNQRISSKEEPINVLVNWVATLRKP